jgi:signal transduction histidine kinase
VATHPDGTSLLHLRDRFTPRARALFFSRLGIDVIALLVMAVPSFARQAGVQQPFAAYWFSALVLTHLVTFFWVGRRGDQVAVFVSLCLDLLALIYLVSITGGLRSPVMMGQIIYTVFFAAIFPSPLAILPPLLTLPVVTKIEQLLGTQMATRDLMLLLWYFLLNVIIVYVVVYLDRREEESFRELDTMQRRRRRFALNEERSRIAREMHDGLGAILSSIVIETEYLATQLKEMELLSEDPQRRARYAGLRQELQDLRRTGKDGMEELRRAVSMMRDDFDLVVALEEHCLNRSGRGGPRIEFSSRGVEQPLAPDQQLACFRILQESLSNALRHGSPTRVDVELAFEPDAAVLTVTDDGAGFDPELVRKGHYGLQNMRERAHVISAGLHIDSTPGEGTRVRLALPYRF